MLTRSALAFVLTALPLSAAAHDEDLRSGTLPPRVGVISDEVAVQRLELEGVRNPVVVGRGPAGIEVRGEVLLRVDPLSGEAVDAMAPATIVRPLGNFVAPVEVPVDRSAIADPALVEGAVEVVEP